MNAMPGVVILTSAFAAILIGAEVWARRRQPNPELTRKFVHLSGGIVCLFFPVLIDSPWLVLAMACTMAGLFACGAHFGFLKSVHGVGRHSRGSEYYPIAIFVVYTMAGDQLWLYVSSILVLSSADAFAALIGSRYGRIYYQVEDNQKSLEGSLTFLCITFTVVLVTTGTLTALPSLVCALSALYVALLVTGFEAVSLRGADNLFVPVATCGILARCTSRALPELLFQTLTLLAFATAIGLLTYRSQTFNTGATIAIILFTYGTFSLGFASWSLPVVAGLVLYVAARRYIIDPEIGRPRLRVRVAARALMVPFLILILANASGRFDFFYPQFLAACAVVTGFCVWNHLVLMQAAHPRAARHAVVLSVLSAGLATFAVPLATGGGADRQVLAAVAASCLAIVVNGVWTGRTHATDVDRIWGAEKALLTLAAAAAVAVLSSL